MSSYSELKKAIVENPLADIDLNTAEQSQDEIAVRGNPWVQLISDLVGDHEFGAPPKELTLPEKRLLIISKVDEGLYSAFLKNMDENSGDYGEVLTKFTKMTPEAMVQALKAKEYLPRDQVEKPEVNNMYTDLSDALKYYAGKELHIHFHKEN